MAAHGSLRHIFIGPKKRKIPTNRGGDYFWTIRFSVLSDASVNEKERPPERGQRSEASIARGPNQTTAVWPLKCALPWRRARCLPPPPLLQLPPPLFHLQGHSNAAGCSGNRVNVTSLHNVVFLASDHIGSGMQPHCE